MPLEEYRAKRDFELHARACERRARGRRGAELRRAEARAPALALRLPPRARWRAGVLGRPQGSVARPRTTSASRCTSKTTRSTTAGSRARSRPASTVRERVIVWDRGTWQPLGDPHAGLAKGDFKFTLSGEKLRGLWVLVRLKPRPGEKRENWLLIKERDEFARPNDEYDVLAEEPEQRARSSRARERRSGLRRDARAGALPFPTSIDSSSPRSWTHHPKATTGSPRSSTTAIASRWPSRAAARRRPRAAMRTGATASQA